MAERTVGQRFLHGFRQLVRPPELQTGDERSASRLELFFDLAFVLVVAELAIELRDDVTISGALTFAGLFTTVWWSWVSATLYANRFDHDDVVYRLYKLAGMAAVIGLAAAAAEATGKRFALWAAAVLAEALVPLLATRGPSDVPLHVEHLPERFALFVILVLGESIAGIPHGLYDAEWGPSAIPVAVLSFVLAAALWWSYFDLAGARAKRLLNEVGGDRSDHPHDVYIFGQLPLTLALAAIGAGIELAVVEGGRGEVPTGTRLL